MIDILMCCPLYYFIANVRVHSFRIYAASEREKVYNKHHLTGMIGKQHRTHVMQLPTIIKVE